MQVSVTFRHMDPTDALKQYAEEKLERLQRYVEWSMDAQVVLSVEKFMHVAELSAQTKGASFQSTERSEDMYASIDAAVDKLERQVVKYKAKLQRR